MIKQLTNKQKVLLIVLLISIDLYAVVIRNTFSTYWLYDNPFYRVIEFTIGLLVADIKLQTTNYKLQTNIFFEKLLGSGNNMYRVSGKCFRC